MNFPLARVLPIAWGAALAGFVVGGALAGWTLLTQTWVREFQAGAESSLDERVLAIVQRATFEGLGFGAIGLLVGIVALALTRIPRNGVQAVPQERLTAHALVVAAAFALWTGSTGVTDEALPFLDAGGLMLLNVGGFLACLFALSVGVFVTSLCPGAPPRDEPVPVAGGALIAMGAAGWLSFSLLLESIGGEHRSIPHLAGAGLSALAAFPLGALVARGLRRPWETLSLRLARGALVPRPVTWAASMLLVLAVAVSAATASFASPVAETNYERTARRKAAALPASSPNVILVTIDTLRADHLGCYGYDRPTSPFIDSLAADGTLFADTSAPAAWTKPSTATILTGLHPSRHGALHHGSRLELPDGEQTLAEAFRSQGYATAGFVTNPNIKTIFDFDRGFDTYFDSPVEDTITRAAMRDSLFGRVVMSLSRYQFNWKYENDIFDTNRHVMAWLDANHSQPFFLYVHYIDPHIPYTPPEQYRREFDREHEGFPLFNRRKELVGIDRYDGEIRYTDDGIRQLVDRLKSLDAWEDTLIVFTSDHGEEFFEHDVMGHGFSLYQPVIGVPLIAHGPGVERGRVVQSPVQIVDMPATLLDLAGTGIDELGDGHSFASAVTDRAWTGSQIYLENEFGPSLHQQRTFVLSGVRQGRYKLILTERSLYRPPGRGGFEAQELYDLEADPDETQNLVHDEAHRALVTEMLDGLMQHAQFLNDSGQRDSEPSTLSDEMEAQLRALGYLK